VPSPTVFNRRKCLQLALIAPGSSHHAIVLACGSVEDATVIAAGIFVISLPPPTRRLIDLAVLPAAPRTRDWKTVIPPPLRSSIGVAVLPGGPRSCRHNLIVCGPVPAPRRCLVGIALLPADRTTDSRDVTSGALLIRRVPLNRAPAMTRGLGTFLLATRCSRLGALGIRRWRTDGLRCP
jgi:hypothetical protein